MKRECGTCTKCCEGWLAGEALGYKFYQGRPCHFIAIGKGCTVYAKRPKDPCISFKCAWLADENIPEWMKPNEINAILAWKKVEDITYLSLIEAGEKLDSRVLTWVIQFALKNNINLHWNVDNGSNWIGSPEFSKTISRLQEIPKDK